MLDEKNVYRPSLVGALLNFTGDQGVGDLWPVLLK